MFYPSSLSLGVPETIFHAAEPIPDFFQEFSTELPQLAQVAEVVVFIHLLILWYFQVFRGRGGSRRVREFVPRNRFFIIKSSFENVKKSNFYTIVKWSYIDVYPSSVRLVCLWGFNQSPIFSKS